MTRDAVEEGLNMYFSSLVSNTRDEVSPSRAVSNVSLPGLDNVVKSVSPQINKELRNREI